MYRFSGQIYSRSSTRDSGPPGETEILEVNPQRKAKLIELGSFDCLESGTLNLRVDKSVVDFLKKQDPDWFEHPDTINPPNNHYTIHYIRGGYKYFCGTITKDNCSMIIIARIGAVNPLLNVLEIYSDQKIRDKLKLSDGDIVGVCLENIDI